MARLQRATQLLLSVLLLAGWALACRSSDSREEEADLASLVATGRFVLPSFSFTQRESLCQPDRHFLCSNRPATTGLRRAAPARVMTGLERWVRREASPQSFRSLLLAKACLADFDPQFREQLDRLQALASVSGRSLDAGLWNDLGVLQLLAAENLDEPQRLARAHEALERALALEPGNVAALFNQALLFETLGVHQAARRAWRLVNAVATKRSILTLESRLHLDALNQLSDKQRWEQETTELVHVGSPLPGAKRVHDLVLEFPQLSREWLYFKLLPLWASLASPHDNPEAERILILLRTFAQAHAAEFGDLLPITVVSEAARLGQEQPGSVSLPALGNALLALRTGYELHRKALPSEASEALLKARDVLRKAGNPLTLLADQLLAACLFSKGNHNAAVEALNRLRHKVRGRGFLTLEGRIDEFLGLIEYLGGRTESGRQLLLSAHQHYIAIGETENLLFVEVMLAESSHLLGDWDQAFRYLLSAVPSLSRLGDDYRSLQAYNAAADFSLRLGEPQLSLLYQDEAVLAAEKVGSHSFLADVFLWRSLLHARAGHVAAANSDLASATAHMRQISDPHRRDRFAADLGVVGGLVASGDTPRQKIDRLTGAVDYFEVHSNDPILLLAYEARAANLHAVGNLTQEREDLLRAIALRERSGHDLEQDGFRLTQAGLVESSFDQMIRFETDQGKNPAASVNWFERSRLLSYPVQLSGRHASQPTPAREVCSLLSNGSALVTYSVLSDRLLIWVYTSKGLSLFKVPVGAEALANLARRLSALSWHSEEWRHVSATLWQLLVAPWWQNKHPVVLVVVPDKELFGVPFAALWDAQRQRFLVEDASLLVAPSATLFAAASQRDRELSKTKAGTPLVIFGNPRFDRKLHPGLRSLAEASGEAEALQRLIPGSRLIAKEHATVEAFLEEAPQGRWLHFAGHAIARPDRPLESYLILAPSPASQSGTLSGLSLAKIDFPYTKLVVLSACGSIAAPRRSWPGATSLARPFLTAGVPMVLGTLWDVNDHAAARVMTELYRSMASGLSPPEALRAAQLAELGDPLDKHGWPSFQLVGGVNLLAVKREAVK